MTKLNITECKRKLNNKMGIHCMYRIYIYKCMYGRVKGEGSGDKFNPLISLHTETPMSIVKEP